MKINRVLIKNFRSIKTLEFRPSDICVLVGENNAGKTNILAALNLLLGEVWPSKRSLDASDYYKQNTDYPIHVEVEFAENPHNIRRMWCTIPWDDKTETRVEYRGGANAFYLSNEIRDRCALVYLDANRNLEYHLGHSRWTLFGRIIRQLDEHFRQTASDEQQQALVSTFNDALRLLKTDRYNKFEQTFADNFHEQIKRTTHQVALKFQTFDPLNYYRSIQTLLSEEGELKNLSQAGQGMRNLILLALFRTYAKVFRDDAIIAIEEPEIYLHPHAQRSLATLFDELAQQENQIFYSTHSGNFVDIEKYDRICLVEKRTNERGDLCTQVRQVSVEQLLQKRRSLHPTIQINELGLRERYHNICGLEHNEAFFARKIVLVEGETEEHSLPIFAQALRYDLDAEGTSIVNAHGKNNLDQLYQLYIAFGVSTYLIFDNDRGGQNSDLIANQILLRMLGQPESLEPDKIVASEYAVLEGNFEKELETYLESITPGKYRLLKSEATQRLGANAGKGLIARYMAYQLVNENVIPDFIGQLLRAIHSEEVLPDEIDEVPF